MYGPGNATLTCRSVCSRTKANSSRASPSRLSSRSTAMGLLRAKDGTSRPRSISSIRARSRE